jgi:hypothetical protein
MILKEGLLNYIKTTNTQNEKQFAFYEKTLNEKTEDYARLKKDYTELQEKYIELVVSRKRK